jgi:hypothetical protein
VLRGVARHLQRSGELHRRPRTKRLVDLRHQPTGTVPAQVAIAPPLPFMRRVLVAG